MTTYYVRKTGLDANAGTSAGAAWLTLAHAASTVAAGDTVYVGAGTYPELLQLSTSGSGGSVILWAADVNGAQTGDPGEVIITGYTTNNTTTPSTTRSTLDLNNKTYNTFNNFTVIGANPGALPSCLYSGTGTSSNCIFNDCVFIASSSALGVMFIVTTSVALNYAFNRCVFVAFANGSNNIEVRAALPATTDYDVGVTFTSCLIINGTTGIACSTTGSVVARVGGVKVLNCDILYTTSQAISIPTNWSVIYPMIVVNTLFTGQNSSQVFNGTNTGSICEEACIGFTNHGYGNAIAGARSVVNSVAYAHMIDFGQALLRYGLSRPFFTPSASSPYINWSNCQVAVGSVPGTATDDASVGTISWTNPGNALVRLESAGEAYAVATALPIVSGTSHYLFISNLGLSIPSNATITGVRALVWAKTSAGTVAANSLKILKTGAVTGTEEATNFKAVAATGLFTGGTTLNTSDTVLGFGGDGVMWGATLAYSDVNNSGFGVALSFKNTHASVTATVSIDYLQVTVYYTQPTLPNDFSNRPRPAGGNVLAAVGILDRHDAAVLNASITDGTNHSWQLTAWDDFDFQVAIPSTATQVSIKCQYDNNYDTTLLPQVTILNGGGCGVADQTIVATTAAHNAWETETFTIAPTSAGVLTVRIQGRSIGVTGKCFFATGPRVS